MKATRERVKMTNIKEAYWLYGGGSESTLVLAQPVLWF